MALSTHTLQTLSHRDRRPGTMTIAMPSFGSVAARGVAISQRICSRQVVHETRQVAARSSSKSALRGFLSSKADPCRFMSSMTCHAASTSSVSESAKLIVDEDDTTPPAAAKVSFSRVELGTRLGAAAVTASALGFCVLADDLPAMRLGNAYLHALGRRKIGSFTSTHNRASAVSFTIVPTIISLLVCIRDQIVSALHQTRHVTLLNATRASSFVFLRVPLRFFFSQVLHACKGRILGRPCDPSQHSSRHSPH